MLMVFAALLGLVQFVRAFLAPVNGGINIDALIVAFLCFIVAEAIRRQNAAAPEEDKEIVPNRPHPLARPQVARPSVPVLPSDK